MYDNEQENNPELDDILTHHTHEVIVKDTFTGRDRRFMVSTNELIEFLTRQCIELGGYLTVDMYDDPDVEVTVIPRSLLFTH